MPKLCWISPYSLHDEFSSAATNCRLLLEGLAQIGWEITSFNAFILEEQDSLDALYKLKQELNFNESQILEFKQNNIHYVYTRCQSHQESQLSLKEMQFFYDAFCAKLDEHGADFVMGFGTDPLIQSCMAEAQRRSIYTIYMLLNSSHLHYNFPNIDFILTTSQANADFYYQHSRINAIPVGEAIDLNYCQVLSKDPKYITFINPSFEKGLSFFVAIAQSFMQLVPEQRFLVVNTHNNFAHNIRLLQRQDGQTTFTLQDFPNVDLTGRQADLKSVYALTKVLIMPSLWHEAWSRTATEATLNGISVITSNIGGLGESTGGAGLSVPIPPQYQQHYQLVPDSSDIQPWVAAIHRLLHEDRSERFAKARHKFATHQTVDLVQNFLLKLYAKQRHRNIAYGDPVQLYLRHTRRHF